MAENTEIQATEQTNAITVQNITNAAPGAMITSLRANPDDRAASVRVFNAMNNPTDRVANHINETIEVQDYLIEMTQIEDTDSYGNGLGSYSVVPRVVLVAPDGTSYQAVSYGIANAVRNVVIVCGDAPWNPAVQLKIKQVPTKRGSMLTVDMVG
jgi:hypothetical protein